ncbi:hypothetical protein ACLSYX_04595 [[Pasteurella] aerogenes]
MKKYVLLIAAVILVAGCAGVGSSVGAGGGSNGVGLGFGLGTGIRF